MLLNIAPPPNSTLPEEAVQEYASLGQWISMCYGVGPVASATALATTFGPQQNVSVITLNLGTPATIDRFLLKEELSNGQLVRAFGITVDGTPIFNGTAIGRSLVILLQKNITGKVVELEILVSRGPVGIRLFAVPNPRSCAVGGGNHDHDCNLIPNTQYVGPTVQILNVNNVTSCCSACGAVPACAFFTAAPLETNTSMLMCKLFSAQQGSHPASGVTSGSPKR